MLKKNFEGSADLIDGVCDAPVHFPPKTIYRTMWWRDVGTKQVGYPKGTRKRHAQEAQTGGTSTKCQSDAQAKGKHRMGSDRGKQRLNLNVEGWQHPHY